MQSTLEHWARYVAILRRRSRPNPADGELAAVMLALSIDRQQLLADRHLVDLASRLEARRGSLPEAKRRWVDARAAFYGTLKRLRAEAQTAIVVGPKRAEIKAADPERHRAAVAFSAATDANERLLRLANTRPELFDGLADHPRLLGLGPVDT